MKKIFALLFIAVIGHVSYAQTNCANAHRIFALPQDKTPAVITRLGASPQFETLRHVRDLDVYFKNLKALANNPKHRDEINTLFRAIGYKGGVADPAFTRDKIEAATIPFGAIGNLGDGKHNYVYALLALKGQKNILCTRIKSANNCNLYIMDERGNAFYYSNAPIERETVKYVERCRGTAKLKVRLVARYESSEECVCNDCENTRYEKEISRELSLAEEKINNIPVSNARSSYPTKTIYLDVSKHTFRRLQKEMASNCEDECCSENECSESCDHSGSHSCEKGASCSHGSDKCSKSCDKKCDKH